MRILYNIGIAFYGLGVRIAALFGGKARLMVEGWRDSYSIAAEKRATAWFHVSSLGEFEQARPVMEKFRVQHPDWRIVLTFFSPSGYEVRKNYPGADVIKYLPLDTPHNALRMVEAINPNVAFFVKYDFWFNCLNVLRKRGIPTYIFSAIFRPQQYFFSWYGGWFLKQLKVCFKHIFVQDEASLNLLKSHGLSNISRAGDTRFDRVADIAAQAAEFPLVEGFASGLGRVLVAGSSWEPDEEYIARYVESNQGSMGIILAPHVISDKHLKFIEELFGPSNCIRYSELEKNVSCNGRKVLVIDNYGMLSSLYRYAQVAYIGGGWGRGIHNLLEAVTWGKPVVFGPNYRKFKEAHDLIARKGGFTYSTFEELDSHLSRLLDDDKSYAEASGNCCAYISENTGVTDIVLNHIKEDLL